MKEQINNMVGEDIVEVTKKDEDGTYTITYQESNNEYTIDANGNFIGENENSDKEVIIPNYINGVPVRAVKGNYYYYYSGSAVGTGIWGLDRCRIEAGWGGSGAPAVYETYQEDITKVIISEGIETIGEYSFNHSTALTEINIPSTVTVIGYYTFTGCSALTTVNYEGTQEQWNSISIERGNDDLLNATINYNY